MINRTIFFDSIRASQFGGQLSQGQVDGMEAILGVWDRYRADADIRWLAQMLATDAHETSMTMLPIEEYGKGAGMAYGEPHPVTGEIYYGRGFVQLTWFDNYVRADVEIAFHFPAIVTDLEWHPEQALDPKIAAAVMFLGMEGGWFRTHDDGKPETLERYFNATVDDPYGAREIINGDKTKIPPWSGGVSIGRLIEGYHHNFLDALEAADDDA